MESFGTLEKVRKALKKRNYIEFGGIEANPQYDTVMKAVDIIKKEKIDFILAVGGGSVLDSAKFISAAVYFEDEPYKILYDDSDKLKKRCLLEPF